MCIRDRKYLGYPYVWGGSSPATSFDCSGFVSWVINHSGWNVGRLGAQGLYNICLLYTSERSVIIRKYSVIYADPPWRYAQKGLQGAAEKHYPTMGIDELCTLPVADLAAPDSVLFLWATFPQLPEALRLIKAWGFTYKSVAFVWLKKNRKSEGWFYGLGFWTRGNAEVCLLATRGHPKRQAANVHQFIISPIQEHSRKPEEAREKIVALMGDVPRVELFARQSPPGWDVWGNEVESTLPDFWTKCPEAVSYTHLKFENNVILTKTEFLTMNTRPKIPANARNLNACIIGSSGSGKTRFWLTPQLLQAHSSYVCVDPKGGVLSQVGAFLQRRGYKVKVFNSIDFSKSMHYNPLSYIHNEADILKFVDTLIANTKGEGKEGDPFWTKAETLLYCALIAYIIFEAPAEDRNINTLVDMISGMDVKEDDESYMNAVDYMFKGLEKRKPDCFAVKQYKKYKLASGKTAKSILISCGSRLAPFDIPQLREIMSYDELELDRIGDRKTAVFFTISDTTPTYNFIVALAFSQMFNLLCERADNVHGGRLPHHVRVLWDEAANTGQVPSLEKLVAVIRSREVSLCLFYQQYAQCKAIYKDNAETILGNMDSVIFLGGRESSTIKEISENWLGKATISMQTEGRSRGQSESYNPVSYTHLDVYKRQRIINPEIKNDRKVLKGVLLWAYLTN